jgi:hypothetical protein
MSIPFTPTPSHPFPPLEAELLANRTAFQHLHFIHITYILIHPTAIVHPQVSVTGFHLHAIRIESSTINIEVILEFILRCNPFQYYITTVEDHGQGIQGNQPHAHIELLGGVRGPHIQERTQYQQCEQAVRHGMDTQSQYSKCEAHRAAYGGEGGE